ncbi:ligand-binding sensor domain-containing diguanylate cyclase [Chiayiivirga flava]|uniref:diguanylate cyclase n=1 Tax=Chiayiivirga flava TaxID=659595 RepID=A0A7W8D6F0_9GAMM|nr:two-component regulator propeller domain-containing protein [Chiayiivirga flava]MBB5208392.1 diguanylate cyclase (GGDEF)-like protein [Chiayiivirga flava]
MATAASDGPDLRGHREHRGWNSLLLACGLLCCAPVFALDPERAIGQLTHVWYENQLPQGTVLSIAQRDDGSMWFATYGGLVRHSGAGFDSIDQRVAPALRSSAITAVHVDRAGTLWVGTLNGGLYRRRGRALEPMPLPERIESVFGIVQDRAGALWLTTNAGVARMDADGTRLLGIDSGFPPRGFYRAIVADAQGGVWIAADGLGVVHWHDGAVEILDTGRGLPTNAVYSLAIDASGTVWAGTQAGPVRYRDGGFEREPRAAALDDKRIYSLFGDSDGTLWFAPLGVGICRLTASRFDCDGTLAGMPGETVRSMFEDREGNVWMGTTSSGVHRFSDSKLVTVTGAMASNAVRAVYEDATGTLWVGTDGAGLARYADQVLQPADGINARLPSRLVRAIEADAAGNLWVGGTEGASRIAPDGSVRNFGIADGLPGTIVFAFAPARDGGMWVGTLQGVARIDGDRVIGIEGTRGDDVRALHEDADGRLWIGLRSGLRCLAAGVLDRCGTDGLPGMSVFAFRPEADGDLWLGTSIGMMRLRDGKVAAFTQRAGFYGDAVFAILDDDDGFFWVSSNRGIARIARADIEALDRGEVAQIEPVWFGKDDGMLSSQANGASQTPAWRSRDGRLWFGTANGVVIVDPDRLLRNALPPPVAVEQALVDGRDVDPDDVGRIGPGVGRIELRYAAMSYVAPAAVRYRYRMQGFDREWIDAGTGRSAVYTNLPPGPYEFRVIASNNDGVWNDTGASVRFAIVPSWYETWWFRALAALAALGLLAAVYRVRLWRLHERERELTREVAQRTEALRTANAQLQRLASLDGLTRIANRGAFNVQLALAWQAHVARGEPLSVLLCDIDAFKAYNDSCGHLAGDAALTAVAGALSDALRSPADLAARYGGEEFAVLLPACGVAQAHTVAQRLLDAVRALRIDHPASEAAAHITISVGVASTEGLAVDASDDLVRAADQALYRAKAGGRDRVCGSAQASRQ